MVNSPTPSRAARIARELLFGAVICAAAAPLHAQSSKRFKPAAVNISGEFREDGTCQVFADGSPVFTEIDSAVTTYIRGAMLNASPPGFETHEVWCAPRSDDRPMPPLDARERALVLMIFPRSGKIAELQTYYVQTGMSTPASAPRQANGALFGMSPQIKGDSTPIRIGMVYLAATRGTFTITRASESRIVGTFTMKGQPTLSL